MAWIVGHPRKAVTNWRSWKNPPPLAPAPRVTFGASRQVLTSEQDTQPDRKGSSDV